MEWNNDTKCEWKIFNARVLVAEDNPANRILIETILKKHGIRVTATENGRQAVNRALAEPFDLILMDMQMPIMNGFEATEMLRQKGFAAPIVALTASVMAGDREKCIECGCDDFISKPIDRKRLQDVLETILTGSANSVTQQVENLNNQTQQLNKLVEEVTPTVPESVINDEPEDS